MGVKPYYQDDLVTLYLADCLPAMREMPDKVFDLAIVDPPYSPLCNLYGGSSSDQEHGWGPNWASNKHHEWNKRPPQEYFAELQRVTKNQVIWGGNYFLEDLGDTSCAIIWDKGQREFSLADGEMAWTSFRKPLRIFSYSRALNNKTTRIHVNQKPVALYRWLLTNYAKPGDTILDTHAGSCSLAIACIDLGFHLAAFEIDEEYLSAAVKRIKHHLSQPKLFSPGHKTMKQETFLGDRACTGIQKI